MSPRPSHPREANCRDDHGVDGLVWELFGTLLRVKGLEKRSMWVSSEDLGTTSCVSWLTPRLKDSTSHGLLQGIKNL